MDFKTLSKKPLFWLVVGIAIVLLYQKYGKSLTGGTTTTTNTDTAGARLAEGSTAQPADNV